MSRCTGAFGSRRGVTLLELLITGFLLIVVVGLMLPAILHSRERSRRNQCQNHLKQFGLALLNYHDAHRVFPPGALSWGQFPDTQVSAACALLPFFEQVGLRSYPGESSWKDDDPRWAATAVPVFVCPSNTSAEVVRDRFLGGLGRTVGDTFGAMSYVYCKGAGDAFCAAPETVPAAERGAFDIDFWCRLTDVTDGASSTIFIGEGATGKPWQICEGVGCTEQDKGPLAAADWVPQQPWIAPHVNTDRHIGVAGLRAGQFASTMEPMNKNPVTDTMIDSSALSDCRSSTNGGPHRTSNFRSCHADGAFFLFGDGSVRFLDEEIDMKLYRGLSTIAGGEEVDDD